MLLASTAPSAAPAPTMVCSSSMKTMYAPFALGQLLHHRLEPLLELAPVLGAGQQQADVERHELAVRERLGHVAVHDPLGQPFDDGGLAHARLADQHRVVLGAAGEHLHDPADLLVPADHRIELSLAGLVGEVAGVALERLVLLLGRLVGDPVRAAHLLERLAAARRPTPLRR